ncbi:MAG: 6,7-dimethyl-8-ribityllumazine synthase [Bauldia sp.]|uniref:6,7-dimethyl-8-ribityllumazine synthase n=1 Tax=Bauldia sp. TaxID=2575872 RepID=UPI001D63C0A6|nr:6,7-dimethyl-8-ribityllumazine synthase [Bauldia sp.]MCB1497285.1 6,7-dimethyl-8-ribityllumazine synthase [Bauldia sp.]
MATSPHLLIIDARFYQDIAEELVRGADAALSAAGATYDHISVPGAFEIPAAMAMAAAAMANGGTRYDGFVLLGCVIRGETSHYDIVAGESGRAIMDLAVAGPLAVGNGILTVDSRDQAMVRARVDGKNKGGAAAEAALAMIAIRQRLGAGQ